MVSLYVEETDAATNVPNTAVKRRKSILSLGVI